MSPGPLAPFGFLGALLLFPLPARAQGLAELLPREPDLWVEVPDMDRLGAELAETSLGRLVGALSAGMDPGELALRLALPEEVLTSGITAGPRGALRGLALEAGFPAEQADALVASLEGRLELARLDRAGPGSDLARLTLAASLRPGGSQHLADEVLRALEASGGGRGRAEGLRLLQIAREGDECRGVWSLRLAPGLPAGYVVLRPRCVALTFDRDLAERLSSGGDGAGEREAGALALARADSRARGELAFARLCGAELEAAAADRPARAVLGVLGMEELVAVELGLATRAGQLTSRLRLVPRRPRREPSGEQPVRQAAQWSSLEVIPTDALAVMGLARSPWVTAEMLDPDDRDGSGLLRRLGRTGLLGALRAPGALRDETLVFVRATPPGIPLVYAATPATPAIDKAFEILARSGASEVALGEGLVLRPKPLVDGRAWIVYSEEGSEPRSVFALARTEDAWVASDVSAQLQALLRQRRRERLAARSEVVARLREAIHEEVVASGCDSSAVVAFLHVRTPAVIELAWPYVQLALQLSGAVEDPEELPDPMEVADLLGDTTVVLLDLEGAIELHGRGLLGGLVLVF